MKKQMPFRHDEKTRKKLEELQEAFMKDKKDTRWTDKKSKFELDYYHYEISLNQSITYAIDIAHRLISQKRSKK